MNKTVQSLAPYLRSGQAALLGLVVLMLGMLYFGIQAQTKSDLEAAYSNAEVRQNSLAGLLGEQLARTFSEADTLLSTLVSEHAHTGDIGSVSRLAAAALPVNGPFNFISVVDRDGWLRYSTRTLAKPVDLSATENFRFHAGNAAQTMYISRPRLGLATNKQTIYLSRRIHSPDDRFAGLVTVALDPDYFTRLVKSMKLAPGTLVAAMGLDGVVRLGCQQEASRVGLDLNRTEYFSQYLGAGANGSFRAAHPVDGVRRIHAVRALERYPLAVLVGQSEDTLLASVIEHNRAWHIKAGAASLCIVLLGAIAVHQVGRAGQARHRVHALADELEAIVDAQPNCVKVTNAAGKILYMNSGGKDLLACPEGETPIGRCADDFILPEYRAAVHEATVQAISGKTMLTTFQIQTMAGEKRWIESRMSLLPSYPGEPRVVSVCNDITDRRLAEERLRRSESSLRDAQWVAQIGDWRLDLQTGDLTWSDEVYRIFEMSVSSVKPTYEGFLQRVHPDDRRTVDETYQRSVKSGQHYQVRHRLLVAGGGVKYVEERGVTEYDNDGVAIRSLGTVQDVTESERAQAAINAERQFANAIFEHAAAFVVVLDADGRILRTNRTLEAMLGHSSVELRGRRPLEEDALGSLEPDRDRMAFQEVIDAPPGMVVHYRNRVQSAQGDVRVVDWTSTTFPAVDGESRHIVAVGIDVTERAAAEERLLTLNEELEHRVSVRTEELRVERNRIASILDVVGALVVVLDRNGKVEQVNREMRAVVGYDVSDLVGLPWVSMFVSTQRDPMEGVLKSLRESRDTVHGEFQLITRTGAVRTIAWTFTKVSDTEGNDANFIATGIDITLQRQFELALQTSEQMFRELAENIREVFFVRDVGSKEIIYVSPTFESIWKHSAKTVLGNSIVFERMLHPADRNRVIGATNECIAAERFECAMEYRILDAQGRTRWLYERTFPVRGADGRVARVAGLIEDVSDRKRNEEERIARLEAQREVLVREVHHRIKNNLQGVAGLLQQHGARFPQIASMVDDAIVQVRTMAIVHGLQAKDPTERIELKEMVVAIVAAVKGTTTKPFELTIDSELPDHVIHAESETVPLALIFNELLTNAAKYGRTEQRPISVVVDAGPGGVVICVENDKEDRTGPMVNWESGAGFGTGLDLVRALVPRFGVKIALIDSSQRFHVSVLVEDSILHSVEEKAGGEG